MPIKKPEHVIPFDVRPLLSLIDKGESRAALVYAYIQADTSTASMTYQHLMDILEIEEDDIDTAISEMESTLSAVDLMGAAAKKYCESHTFSSSSRRSISAKLRRDVYERDKYRCVSCGTHKSLSLDHIHPYSMGGEDTYENLQTMCRSCNSSKGIKTPNGETKCQ